MRIDTAGERTFQRPGRWRLQPTRTKYNAWMNGAPLGLADLDERIYIVNIKEASKEDVTSTERARYDGSWVVMQTRSQLEITFQIMVKEELPEERMQVIRKIIAWCEEGELRVSTRPNQKLTGVFTRYPMGSMQNWTENLELTFTAYGLPYWQEDEVAQATGNLNDGLLYITPKGNTEYAYLTFTATPTDGQALTWLGIEILVDNKRVSRMTFRDVYLEANRTLSLTYDLQHYLRLAVGDDDWNGKRAQDSDDDLIIIPGKQNTINIAASTKCSFTFAGRGLYL